MCLLGNGALDALDEVAHAEQVAVVGGAAGGNLDIASSPGKGTTVVVDLPVPD